MSIGVEITIEKIQEDEREAVYRFRVQTGHGGLVIKNPTGLPGRAKITKSTGNVSVLESSPDDIPDGFLASRVSTVLRRHWKEGKYPNLTWWTA